MRHRKGLYCCDCPCPECKKHRGAINIGQNQGNALAPTLLEQRDKLAEALRHIAKMKYERAEEFVLVNLIRLMRAEAERALREVEQP